MFDYIELTDEYSIYEIAPLENWVGHSIREIDVRNKYHINILGVKEGGELKPLPAAIIGSPGTSICWRWPPARTRRSCCARCDARWMNSGSF